MKKTVVSEAAHILAAKYDLETLRAATTPSHDHTALTVDGTDYPAVLVGQAIMVLRGWAK